MLNLGLKLWSWRYKQSIRRSAAQVDNNVAGGRIPPNASFLDGVATKDCVIDPSTALSVRIFLPAHCLGTADAATGHRGFGWLPERQSAADSEPDLRSSLEILSDASSVGSGSAEMDKPLDDVLRFTGGYQPRGDARSLLKLPVIVQFHDGAFVSGCKDSAANDAFCRRIARACKCVVVAVDYRLAPAHRFPAARDDGLFTLRWLAKQANLAAFPTSVAAHGLIGSFGELPVDPWISAHLDFSRCVLMGIGAGGSISLQISQEIVGLKLQLEPLRIMNQVLLHPLLGGDVSLTDSSHFMDKDMLSLAWSSLLPENSNSIDHPAANPLRCSRLILARMPATLVISAEQESLRDRAAALVQALKNARVDATSIVYRNAVYGFASMECFMDTKLAHACVEDIAMWFAKHVRCDYWS